MKHDWEAIERDYATGNFTLRELEAKHGAGKSTIAARAKKDGWTQDLRQVVRQATEAAVLRDTVPEAARLTPTETVLAAAEVNKQVILRHRKDLLEARSVANSLLGELRDAALLADETDLLAQIVAGDGADSKDVAQARRVVMKALGLGSRVASVKALAEALAKLQAAEREAFGIDGGDGDAESSIADRLRRAEERLRKAEGGAD